MRLLTPCLLLSLLVVQTNTQLSNTLSNIVSFPVDLAGTAWNGVKSGFSTVGNGFRNASESVSNFFRGNGLHTNNYVNQQSIAQGAQYGQGYYPDSPYRYNGYEYITQNPADAQPQYGYQSYNRGSRRRR